MRIRRSASRDCPSKKSTIPSLPARISRRRAGNKRQARWRGNFTFFLDDPVHGDQREQADHRFIGGMRSLFELAAGYGLGKKVRVTAEVFNLFNRAVSDVDYYFISRLSGEPFKWGGGRHDTSVAVSVRAHQPRRRLLAADEILVRGVPRVDEIPLKMSRWTRRSTPYINCRHTSGRKNASRRRSN